MAAVVLAITVAVWNVKGDGKVFPPTAFPTEVRIPDQSAILIWSNGIERLVIETRFEGKGTNFAWVVPLPAAPVIEPATTGVFTTLRHIFQPEIQHVIDPIWAGVLFAGALLWLTLTVRAHESGFVADFVACVLAAAGAGAALRSPFVGLAVMAAASFATHQSRRGREPIYSILLTVGLVGVLTTLLLPALGKAKGGVSATDPAESIDVLDQKRVGVFETTTVAARDPAALPRWLETNGFALTAGSRPIVEQYAREGWVFVAAKAQRDSLESGPSALHPLSFIFPATNLVYPLRLTAVGSDRVSIELFVFGPGRAAASGFAVTECHRPEWPEYDSWWRPAVARIGHATLRDWAGNAATVTRLAGTLDSVAMRNDANVSWEQFQSARTRLYSTQGAWLTGLNWGMPFAIGIILFGAVRARAGRMPWRAVNGYLLAGLLLVGVVASVVFLSLPHIPVRLMQSSGRHAKGALQMLAMQASLMLDTNRPTIASVRAAVSSLQPVPSTGEYQNQILGGAIREDDSPGNFTLRESDEGVEFRAYDLQGKDQIIWVFSTNEASTGPRK